jgi:hypothetical protein
LPFLSSQQSYGFEFIKRVIYSTLTNPRRVLDQHDPGWRQVVDSRRQRELCLQLLTPNIDGVCSDPGRKRKGRNSDFD